MLTESDIHALSDVELLELLCSSEDDAVFYKHFVNRYIKDIQTECLRVCKNRKLDDHVGKQIAHETFERVKKYKSFKTDKIHLINERKAVTVYLNRISIRLFNDHRTKKKSEDNNHKSYFEDILSPEKKNSSDIQSLKNKKDLATLIYKKLNTKEQKIILTDLEYKRHYRYLPDDVIDALASELNIKRDTVRKIRERAIEKIRIAIDEIN